LVEIWRILSQDLHFDTRKIKEQFKETPVSSLDGIRMIKEDLKKDSTEHHHQF